VNRLLGLIDRIVAPVLDPLWDRLAARVLPTDDTDI